MDLRDWVPPPASVPTAALAEVGAAAMGALRAAMGAEGDLVDLRLARGCRCFAACRGELVAAYGWLSTGPEWIGELGLEIRPPAGEAYVWNCQTLPAHRRAGFFRWLLLHIVGQARAEGVQRLWIASAEGGAESAVVDAGFKSVLELRSLRLAGMRRIVSAASAGTAEEAVAAARHALGLGPRPVLVRARLRRH